MCFPAADLVRKSPSIFVAAFALAVTSFAHGQEMEGLKEVRRHMLDANLVALTFRTMDQIFPTRVVDTTTPVWVLPSRQAKLDFAYEYAGKTYSAEEVLDRTYTNALIIIKHGNIVFETYRNQASETTHFVSMSMSKSITSILIGLALADGSIHSVDDAITAYVPELKDSAYEGVTIRQALMMRSGVDYTENSDFGRPSFNATAFEEAFVQGRVRLASFARILARAHSPGEQFNYSSMDTAVLGWVLERATKQTLSRFMSERLWKPMGMESYGYWILDGLPDVGREFTAGGFNAVARDYARLGLLMLDKGKVRGKQIVAEKWVRESTVPDEAGAGPPATGTPYKYHWWLMGPGAFAATGTQGQFIYVDTSTDTVIVKLSSSPPALKDKTGAESVAFLQAASRWNVR